MTAASVVRGAVCVSPLTRDQEGREARLHRPFLTGNDPAACFGHSTRGPRGGHAGASWRSAACPRGDGLQAPLAQGCPDMCRWFLTRAALDQWRDALPARVEPCAPRPPGPGTGWGLEHKGAQQPGGSRGRKLRPAEGRSRTHPAAPKIVSGSFEWNTCSAHIREQMCTVTSNTPGPTCFETQRNFRTLTAVLTSHRKRRCHSTSP